VAKGSHAAARRAKHATSYHDDGRGGRNLEPADSGGEGGAASTSSPRADEESGILTDAQWERVRELLPRQEPGQRRPRRDDRQVLCGILWIIDSGSSWLDLPEEKF
jgi:hypothetical protein